MVAPTVSGTYTYTGSEQTVTLTGFDADSMTITGNKGTNAGNFTANVTLKDSNYCFADNKSSIDLSWSIAAMDISSSEPGLDETTDYSTVENGQEVTITLDGQVFTGTVTSIVDDGNGNYTITVSGTGNYSGNVSLQVKGKTSNYISSHALHWYILAELILVCLLFASSLFIKALKESSDGIQMATAGLHSVFLIVIAFFNACSLCWVFWGIGLLVDLLIIGYIVYTMIKKKKMTK